MVTQNQLRPLLATTLESTDFPDLRHKYAGKVRDVYTRASQVILISTDRQSAFDKQWCTIPLKGQVLNHISNWWFDRVKDVMPTHILGIPDPSVTLGKLLRMLKVEIVVRAYLTGSTSTSIWVNYERGVRNFCGNALSEGMKKNQKLSDIIFTPSTKPETGHDVSMSPEELVARTPGTTASQGPWCSRRRHRNSWRDPRTPTSACWAFRASTGKVVNGTIVPGLPPA